MELVTGVVNLPEWGVHTISRPTSTSRGQTPTTSGRNGTASPRLNQPSQPNTHPETPAQAQQQTIAVVPAKRKISETKNQEKTEVRGTIFNWEVSNEHGDIGFTPYSHKNIMELRGVIPLTIFNRTWQEVVLVYHSQNTPKEEKSDRGIVTYKGKPDPEELRQTHSKWTLNHACFRETMRKYKYPVLARWLKLHKDNCDRLREKSGFMTALRYDIIIRRNAIAFWTENNGKESFSNIFIFKTDTAETVYAES
ncbi:hypothetical protein MJO29_013769 [Puccinia striiformis f. sp. tritici]|nr:hypothetical protein MJO29_013769 [Puccinia striiformis f. sp. tritici]